MSPHRDPENQFIASQMVDFRDAGYTDMYIGVSGRVANTVN